MHSTSDIFKDVYMWRQILSLVPCTYLMLQFIYIFGYSAGVHNVTQLLYMLSLSSAVALSGSSAGTPPAQAACGSWQSFFGLGGTMSGGGNSSTCGGSGGNSTSASAAQGSIPGVLGSQYSVGVWLSGAVVSRLNFVLSSVGSLLPPRVAAWLSTASSLAFGTAPSNSNSNSNNNSSSMTANTFYLRFIVAYHSSISLWSDHSLGLKVLTVALGLLWIFGQDTLYDIEDLRYADRGAGVGVVATAGAGAAVAGGAGGAASGSGSGPASSTAAASSGGPGSLLPTSFASLLPASVTATCAYYGLGLRNVSKSLADNAVNGAALNALWLVTVTLYLPVLYGFQHFRLFSESAALTFALIGGAQYFLWNLLRVYLCNRHAIVLDVQRYGCWMLLSAEEVASRRKSGGDAAAPGGGSSSSSKKAASQPAAPPEWKVGQRYVRGDVVKVSTAQQARQAAQEQQQDQCKYYELVSRSSCITDAQLLPQLLPPPSSSGGGSGSATTGAAPGPLFPLSSVLWCYCNPVLALLMTAVRDSTEDADTDTDTADGSLLSLRSVFAAVQTGASMLLLKSGKGGSVGGGVGKSRCNALFASLESDLSHPAASTVAANLLFLVLLVALAQAVLALFQPVGLVFIIASSVQICLVLYTLSMLQDHWGGGGKARAKLTTSAVSSNCTKSATSVADSAKSGRS